MSRAGLRFRPHPLTPAPPAGAGVAICLDATAEGPLPVVHGLCQTSEEAGDRLFDTILHNVQLTLTSEEQFASTTISVVGTRPVFADDVQRQAGLIRACFNVDLAEEGIVPVEGRYWLVASFADHTSDVLEFDGKP